MLTADIGTSSSGWTSPRGDSVIGSPERHDPIACSPPLLATPRSAEIRLDQLAHFALHVPLVAVDLQEASGQLERFLLRLRLEDGVAADDFLGFREWPIGHGKLAAAQP